MMFGLKIGIFCLIIYYVNCLYVHGKLGTDYEIILRTTSADRRGVMKEPSEDSRRFEMKINEFIYKKRSKFLLEEGRFR